MSTEAMAAEDRATAVLDAFSHAVTTVVDRVAPAVVHVADGRGGASGFVIAPDGWILTNAHVVERSTTVEISFRDGTTARGTVEGRVRRSYIGISGAPTPIGRPLAAALGIAAAAGIRVLEVIAGSPADGAGIRSGDIIAFVDATAVPTLSALQRLLTADRIFRRTPVVVIRRGERLELSVVPQESG